VLFDLHYEHENPLSRKKLDHLEGIEGYFDAVILGGDNAELSHELQNHRVLFERLKRRFECPTGFILGNHELWGKLKNISSWKLLNEVFPDLGREYGFNYLEQENLDSKKFSFVGTYGHFDYSFLRPNKGVSREDLLRGTFITNGKKITWNDRNYMDWESNTDEEVCEGLIKKFGERIKRATGEVLISFSHTIPRLTLNGWPDSSEQYFMEAYSGSNSLGKVLETSGGEYHFCGHTHVRAKDKIGKTATINLGSNNNLLRYAILQIRDTKTNVKEIEVALT